MDDLIPTVTIRGATLQLLPEKLAFWSVRRTLLVADTHFGKAATFRKFGIPVPEEPTQAMLDRLTLVIERFSASRLIILGDFIHSNVKHASSFEASLLQWRQRHCELEIVLLLGNHDRGRADLFANLNFQVIPHVLYEEPFAFTHDAATLEDSPFYRLAGHIHPQIQLSEGKKKLRLPCFWFGSDQGILPAYGDFTGCSTVKIPEGDQVFVVAEHVLIEIAN
jgi:DNA ligase-associated metallophosphoesterase